MNESFEGQAPLERETVIAAIREKGVENQDVIELLRRWIDERITVAEEGGNEARLELTLDLADMYAEAGVIEEARLMLSDALMIAESMQDQDKYDDIWSKLQDLG